MTACGQDARIIKIDKVKGRICTNFTDWKFVVKATEFWTPTESNRFRRAVVRILLDRDRPHLKLRRVVFAGFPSTVTARFTSPLPARVRGNRTLI